MCFPGSCSIWPSRSLRVRGTDGETKGVEAEGQLGEMPRRKYSGKGPRGRQKAQWGWQWEGAGLEDRGTSGAGGASGCEQMEGICLLS